MSDIDRAIAMIEARIQYLEGVKMHGPEGVHAATDHAVPTIYGWIWFRPRPWLSPDYPFPLGRIDERRFSLTGSAPTAAEQPDPSGSKRDVTSETSRRGRSNRP